MKKYITPLLLGFLLTAFYLPTSDTWESKVLPRLLDKAHSGEEVAFLVLLRNPQGIQAQAHRLTSKTEKATWVHQHLKKYAHQSQQRVLNILASEKRFVRSFYIVNAVYAKGDLHTIQKIARLKEVQWIIDNPAVPLETPEITAPSPTRGPAAIEWGIGHIHADEVWEMGYRGQGVVIGGQDTGYEWEHPALQASYRGWDGSQADHNYHWHDAIHSINPLHGDSTLDASNNPCGLDVPFPCDDHNHGTHTMGTMTGDDGVENQIGVAPAAKWIACRNMERGWGSPASYIECYEWFVAPTDLNDENADPTKAPDVINNSWTCPPIEGCDSLHIALMETVVNHVKASGIVVVVSAGNSGGGGCGTVSTPSAIYEQSFTVGSIRSNDTISGFSSRGPAMQLDSTLLLKPNVVAPGSGVRSSIRNGGYASFSGTSMAGPHVAGAVALLLSAQPALKGQVEAIEAILEQSARPKYSNEGCGALDSLTVPNHVYGYGVIDIQAAVALALQNTPTQAPASPHILTVSPNPFHDEVLFDAKGAKIVQIVLYDARGQQVLAQKNASSHTIVKVSLPYVPNGLYFYSLKTEENSYFTGKVIKAQ